MNNSFKNGGWIYYLVSFLLIIGFCCFCVSLADSPNVSSVVVTEPYSGYFLENELSEEEIESYIKDWENCTDEVGYVPEMLNVEATAYYDSYGHGYGADGRKLVEGLTIAGKPEWLGLSGALYDDDMRLIGIYEFRDTGYGQSTGKGKSIVCPGKKAGTIESGQCVDIYFKTKEQCIEWGRRKVKLQLINAKG